MKKTLLIAFSLISLNGYASNRYAILIGINKYLPDENITSQQNKRGIYDLDASLNDVASVKFVLKNKFSFSENNIFTLLDSQATRANILSMMQNVLQKLKPDDILFFYYSGHGSQVYNSKSKKPDKLEQSIVPADVLKLDAKRPFTGSDIRSKELAGYFNKFLSKGIRVTAVFDCCHSGSMTRGINDFRMKRIMPLNMDVADGTEEKPPAENGALIFSAAQEDQSAIEDHKEKYGLFTRAFVKALTECRNSTTANELFLQTKAVLNYMSMERQEPDIQGDQLHKNSPLFFSTDQLQADKSPSIEIPLIKKEADGKILLDGGLLSGLDSGDVVAGINSTIPCKLRIVSLDGLNKSYAVACTGNTESPKSGDLFTLEKKCKAPPTTLNVFVPFSNYSFNKLKEASNSGKDITASSETELLADIETKMIWFDKAKWHLTKKSTLSEIKQSSSLDSLIPLDNDKYLLCLPAYDSLSAWLKKNFSGSTTIHLTDMDHADYMLAGLPTAEGILYQWINIFEIPGGQNMFPTSLSPVVVKEQNTNRQEPAFELTSQVKNIYKVKKWMNIQSPIANNNFPYHFCFINKKTNMILTDQLMKEGDTIWIALQLDTSKVRTWDKKRMWMYLYSYDAVSGSIDKLYPETNSENQYPKQSNSKSLSPLYEPSYIVISPPFGNVMLFAICSESALSDPDALTTQPSQTATRGMTGEDVLDFFQSSITTRGLSGGNDNWSMEKQVFTTVPAGKN